MTKNLPVPALLLELAHEAALRFAAVPVSRFPVGAVLVGATTGKVYFGANFEIAGPSIAQTVHAEQAAFVNAWHAGERGIAGLAVTHNPCGHCRQFLAETLGTDFPIYVAGEKKTTLTQLLPRAFGPRDLGNAKPLMASTPVKLALTEKHDALAAAALDAARRSYAPHTKGHMGVAIELNDGQVFAGRYAESAAYNPSLPALQAALILRHLADADSPIVRAAIVGSRKARFDETLRAQEMLAWIAPKAKVKVFIAR
jgi:cytidine deaminase